MKLTKQKLFTPVVYILIGVPVVFSTQGCTEIKNVSGSKIDSINQENYLTLNGRYSNKALKSDTLYWREQTGRSYYSKSLWNLTYGFLKEKPYADLDSQDVEIKFASNKKLSLVLYQGNTPIAKRIIRGKLENGYFNAKPHLAITPFFPLVFGYSGFRGRIGIDKQGLSVDYAWRFWGFAILAGSSGSGQTHSIFKKK
jgi:hypothetical protein